MHDDEEIRPPGLRDLAREARVILEISGLHRAVPSLKRCPRGEGAPVMVLPGFMAGDGSTLPMRSYLRWLGHDARGWRLGRNHGDAPALLPRILDQLEAVVAETGRAVSLVGWSLGGFLAREATRDRPDLVERVITMGSPVIGGPRYTAVAPLFARRWDVEAIIAEIRERGRRPIERPITAILSRSDGVVAWRACLDHDSPSVEHIEIESTHAGLGIAPEALRVVADRLAPADRA